MCLNEFGMLVLQQLYYHSTNDIIIRKKKHLENKSFTFLTYDKNF